MNCVKCGATITPTAKFCPECGAIQTSQPTNQAQPSMPNEKPESPALTSDDESLHQPSQPRSLASNRLLWLGITVVVIALVSVGSWAWILKHPITAKAQYDLGLKYETGDGVPQDYSKAAFWYRKAAEHGDGNAQTRLDELPIPHPLTPETISKVHEFEHGDWTKVLLVPQVSQTAARLFGSQLPYFREIGTGGAGVKDGLLIVDGCIPHDCPNGGILTIDVKTGAATGGLVDESGVTVYTGDYTRDSLPTVLKQWLEDNNNLSVRYKEAQIPVFAGGNTLDAEVQELLSKDKSFQVCQTAGMTVVHFIVRDATATPLSSRRSSPPEDFYLSASSLPLAILRRNGSVAIDGDTGAQARWRLTLKGHAFLGSTILSEHTSQPDLDIEDLWASHHHSNVTSCSSPEVQNADGYGLQCTEEMRWTIVLGCREFGGIDATTPLADGKKIDFSWHWKPTDFGSANGLTDERQRGVAYLTRSTSTGLVVDRIDFEQTAQKVQ